MSTSLGSTFSACSEKCAFVDVYKRQEAEGTAQLAMHSPSSTEKTGCVSGCGRSSIFCSITAHSALVKMCIRDSYKEGAQKASYLAEKTLRKVYKKVGFVAR